MDALAIIMNKCTAFFLVSYCCACLDFFSANDFIRPFFFLVFLDWTFFSVLGVTIFKNSINGRFCPFFSLLVNAVEGNTSPSIYGRGCVVLITIVARQYKVHRPVEQNSNYWNQIQFLAFNRPTKNSYNTHCLQSIHVINED